MLMNEVAQLKPVRTDSRPLYLQAIESIRSMILDGEYQAGDRLPKESVFADQLGISRSTLRVALGYLETYGLISRRPGVGTFVATTVPPSPRYGYLTSLDRFETLLQIAKRAEVNANIVSRELTELTATAELAEESFIDEGDPVFRVQIVESINGSLAAYFDTYLAAKMIDRQALVDYQDDVITYLTSIKDLAPTHTRSEVWAKNAEGEIASKLNLREGQAVLYLKETFHTRHGRCVAYCHNYFVSEIFRFYLIRKLVGAP
jgi:GntR family transcriptional regulator